MVFWGIEVKPGKPITHSPEKARGRLRVSQATLGIGEATNKTIVQCNVVNRSPVFLCALLPNITESCHLELEFEEADDVIFSVIGPRSVYLTGYFVQRIRHLYPHTDTESYGVDIENTQSKGSSDDHFDSFINDIDKSQVCAHAPTINDQGKDEAAHEHADEDENPLSLLMIKKAAETTMSYGEEQVAKVILEMGKRARHDGVCAIEPEENGDQLDINREPEGVTNLQLDEEKTVVTDEKNELPMETETLENTNINQSLPMNSEIDQFLDSAKSEKKRKKGSTKENTCDLETHNKDNIEEKEHGVEASTEFSCDENSEDGKKSKKIRNQLQLEGIEKKDDKSEHGLLHPDDLTWGMSRENQEISSEEINTESHDISTKEEKFVQVLPHDDDDDSFKDDHTAETDEYLGNQIDKIISIINKEILASDSHPKKTKKKKKKTKTGRDLNLGITSATDTNDHTINAPPIIKRTLSNGLVIEELASGPPDGKVATLGMKVKIYYIAMLKETGHVYDSNVGKSAFQFRLGDEKYIDGWNVGIDGMRVGDKRRLIIPPLLGFGDHGIGDVPPNSWVVNDIELVGVRK